MASGPPRATCRPFGLGFPPAPRLRPLSPAAQGDSQAYSTKDTPQRARARRDILWAHGFRFYFTPLAGVLFAFPSRYSSLSVAARVQPWIVVDPDSGRVPRAPPYSGTAPREASDFAYGAVTLSGRAVRRARLSSASSTSRGSPPRGPTTPERIRFGLLPLRSPLLGESLLISSPRAT